MIINESKERKILESLSVNESLRGDKFQKMYLSLEKEANRGNKRSMKWIDEIDQEMMKYLPGLSDSISKDFDSIKDEKVKKKLYDRASMLSGIE